MQECREEEKNEEDHGADCRWVVMIKLEFFMIGRGIISVKEAHCKEPIGTVADLEKIVVLTRQKGFNFEE